jgi:DNA-binding transcriptional ArsR family regulator
MRKRKKIPLESEPQGAGEDKDLQRVPEARGKGSDASQRLQLQLRRGPSVTCNREEAVSRMARLIGDSEKAECKVDRLRTLTSNVDETEIESEAAIFKAMSDPCRLRILLLLKEGELCVCEIMVALDRPQSTTSHHLSILKEEGLIRERKDGKWSRYRLAEGAIIEMLNLVKLIQK